MTDIFQEVDEEVRRENLQRLWKRYGRFAVGAGVVVLLVIAGVIGWQRYTEHREAARAQQFSDAIALLNDPDPAKARAAFQELAQGSDGIAAMARFRAAGLQVDAKDQAGAVATYDAIAADSGIPQPFRDAATLMAAYQLADTADLPEIERRLNPLTVATNPWRFSALELIALSAQRAGDLTKARTIFTQLADDLQTPTGLRARAAEMLAALKEK
ncbi:MAG TPA: tetratricopeptide repeat protein [Dongiaceae bacterium]